MAKKVESAEEEVFDTEEEEAQEAEVAPRLQNDFQREDLNELRDVVNELWAGRG